MAVLDWLIPWRSSRHDAMVTSWPVLEYLWEGTQGKSIPQLWKEQPHLRTVVGFLTRNAAQVGLSTYTVGADGARKRQHRGMIADVLRQPNPHMTAYELVEGIVGDLALFDNAYLLVVSVEEEGRRKLQLWLLRPSWIQAAAGLGPYTVDEYIVMYPEVQAQVRIPASKIIHFHGWNPVDARVGQPPVTALMDTLNEQIYAVAFRSQLWQRGGRVGSYLTRPADAPEWDPKVRTKFKREFASQWAGNGSKAGGVPLLEDGMELKRVGFAAREEQFVEATKLSLTTVAAAYYINPTMVGLLDNANYSNVREFRRMLYGETLGPVFEEISQRLMLRLLPHADLDNDGRTLITFDTESRLRGSFEEQMAVATQATGGPVLTTNEFRSQLGYAPIDGGDELRQPLNVTKPGDQDPVPADTPTGNDDAGNGGQSSDTGKTNGHRVELDAAVTKILEGIH